MGHAASKVIEVEGPFSSKHHDTSCPLRLLVVKRDFVPFLEELKSRIHTGHGSIGFASPALLQRCSGSSNPKPGDFQDIHDDVLSYKADHGPETAHFVYVRCSCKGRYAGLDINRLDSRGMAAIHVAVRRGDPDMLTLLLNLGANAAKASRWGLTPLHIACETGNQPAVANLLHEAGVDPNETEQLDLKNIGNERRTPLIVAATHGHTECLLELLNKNADCNLCDYKGNTALHKAAVYGVNSSIAPLLKYGAELNAQNHLGLTALHLALMQTHKGIVKDLLKAGATVTHKCDAHLPSILSVAAMTGEVQVLDQCIAAQQNIDEIDASDRTPLYYTFTGDVRRLRRSYPAIEEQGICFDFHHAMLPERRFTFRRLIEHGADIERMLKDALWHDALSSKHFTLHQYTELFGVCLCSCGLAGFSNADVDQLFWKLLSRNNERLVRVLLNALPRLCGHLRPKFCEVLDWTGAHTDDAVVRHLENAGADASTAEWVLRQTQGARSLRDWSRQAIRSTISANVAYRAPRLPLPNRLIDFVMMTEFDDEISCRKRT
ncbi:hypothetical protein CAPTEDRAFT_162329 [Capitella teleta]|uniref:SOCS box domain-containing protein n=1 Tax=Capitella teleta TaxID=283909 RepID=R7TPZ2_CAPTE|nr:hypothetical protein CAPTEDRAFT_162329 [Capitella teleta]|eukprot:ELT95724.1 hypothetical protein CAPTEDRAFT_162329 [Capitella teleta]